MEPMVYTIALEYTIQSYLIGVSTIIDTLRFRGYQAICRRTLPVRTGIGTSTLRGGGKGGGHTKYGVA